MTTCDKCGAELHIGDFPFCPHGAYHGIAVGDECDVYIKHGLCNEDGTPKRYRSKTEIRRAEKERGFVNMVKHVDGDRHVSRWV